MKNLMDYIDEVRNMIDNLRKDFRAHDHGASYNAGTVRIAAAPVTFSGTAESAAAMADWAKYMKKS